MATVEVSHKAASVCSSSKTTDIYVASLPGLPTSLLPVYTHGTFETNSASLGNLSKSGKRLSLSSQILSYRQQHGQLISCQLYVPCWLGSKQFLFLVRVCESVITWYFSEHLLCILVRRFTIENGGPNDHVMQSASSMVLQCPPVAIVKRCYIHHIYCPLLAPCMAYFVVSAQLYMCASTDQLCMCLCRLSKTADLSTSPKQYYAHSLSTHLHMTMRQSAANLRQILLQDGQGEEMAPNSRERSPNRRRSSTADKFLMRRSSRERMFFSREILCLISLFPSPSFSPFSLTST